MMKPDYILEPERIVRTIERAFPGWKIEGLSAVCGQPAHSMVKPGWMDLEPARKLGECQNFANMGYECFSFLLTHENGGEARPDYWAWEIGEVFSLKPGGRLQLDVNQGWREAWVLAVIDDEALVEYRMPAGTTAMQIVQNRREPICGRSVSYRSCPIFWQKAIRAAGGEWEGRSQTGRTVEMKVSPDWEPAESV